MKPEYRRTFWSTQTGYAYSQGIFLDNDGNDAKRIGIFEMNERHWRAIRDRVRQWVLAMYAAWQALKPVWFTDAVKAQIPDAFIPTDARRQENARAPQTVGRLRSLSFVLGAESDADRTSVVGALSPQPMWRRGRRRCPAERTGSPVEPSQRLQLVPQPTHKTFLESPSISNPTSNRTIRRVRGPAFAKRNKLDSATYGQF
jgi:hypothetical protein